MKITDLKMFYVPHRFLFLKIETDEGISGWGEPIVEGRAGTLEASVNEWKSYLLGKDPLKIEEIWQTMYRCAFYRGGAIMMSTIAGVNQALWDIKGKFFNVPVYELLGGAVKDRVKVYRSIQGETPQELAADAKKAMKEGYSILKTCPCPISGFVDSYDKIDFVDDMISAVKEVIGNKCDLAIDFHGRMHRPMAKLMIKRLEKHDLLFIEEPVIPTNKEAMKEFAKWSATPIATGERMYSRWDFKDMFIDGTVDIVQPDLSHAGGISECMRIASMAEAFDVALAPHCPLSVIAFASCIQVDTACANAVFQEQQLDIHNDNAGNPFFQVLKDPSVFQFKDGFITPPKSPGLGIEINEELVEELNKNKHDWKNPRVKAYDGTPIEW
jgi:galactonate dehydratase